MDRETLNYLNRCARDRAMALARSFNETGRPEYVPAAVANARANNRAIVRRALRPVQS